VNASEWSRIPFWVFTGGLAILFIFPIAWAMFASVSGQAGSAQLDGYGIENYRTLVEFGAGLPLYFFNSALLAFMTVGITLGVSILGGYAFARFEFPLKNVMFLLTLAILMVPYATVIIPLYVILQQLGMLNSLLGLAIVLAMFQLPFATFMMRISFEAVPKELEESALVDGCNRWQVFVKVVWPMARTGLFATAVFTFIFAWNEFIFALVLTRSAITTFPVQVTHYFGGQSNFWAKIAAMSALGTVPIFIVVALLQRFLVRGMSLGAVKG